MPYVTSVLRDEIREETENLIFKLENNIDENDRVAVITYVFFVILKHFYSRKNWFQRSIPNLILKSVETEFNRRFIFPYENQKMKQNGDV
ncbi:MAG: hypothetical protein NWE98_02125 [Candidatus Bathyarchaeota archaeon]|nr:hypothetical protein [Candidatus Bathyarchaeota archaeon]